MANWPAVLDAVLDAVNETLAKKRGFQHGVSGEPSMTCPTINREYHRFYYEGYKEGQQERLVRALEGRKS